MIGFNGENYNDDRMFVLYLCQVTEDIHDDHIETTVYHVHPPPDAVWGLVTYRNVQRYVAVRVDTFTSKTAALEYIRRVEPTVPLISLDGRSPDSPMDYDEFVKWKAEEGLQDYDYRLMYAPGGEAPREFIVRPVDLPGS